jgi:hypothetical protein
MTHRLNCFVCQGENDVPPFLYRCPNTGDNIQAWAADVTEDDDVTYVTGGVSVVRSGASGEPKDRQGPGL